MRAIEVVRKHIETEEFDYPLLMEALRSYQKPRDAISRLLVAKSILRVKKGLYVFGDYYRRSPICIESIANLMYGPSYISLEYALSYYNLIPERVEQITSMTLLRTRIFSTPLGNFQYVHLHPDKMAVGVTQIEVDRHHQILIATPEKALADRLAAHRNLMKPSDVHAFVCEGLRIEEKDIASLHFPLAQDIASVYKSPPINALAQLIKELQC